MNEILLMLHFLGLGMGFAGSLGGFALTLVTNASPPQDAPVLARVAPVLMRIGQIGLALLLVTGPLLLWLKWGWVPPAPTMFMLKMIFVAAVTIMIALIAMTAGRARRARDMTAAARLPLYGRIATTFLGLVVIFAVLAFD